MVTMAYGPVACRGARSPGSVTPTEINCFGPPHKQDDGAWPVAVTPLNVLRRFGVTTFASRYRTVRPSGGIANAHQALSSMRA